MTIDEIMDILKREGPDYGKGWDELETAENSGLVIIEDLDLTIQEQLLALAVRHGEKEYPKSIIEQLVKSELDLNASLEGDDTLLRQVLLEND